MEKSEAFCFVWNTKQVKFFRQNPAYALVAVLFFSCLYIWVLLLSPRGSDGVVTVKALDAAVFGSIDPKIGSLQKVQTILAAQDIEGGLGAIQKTSGCAVRGPLPDSLCTPGSVFATAGTSTICVSGYTKTVRNVPTKLRKQIYAAYNIAYPPPTGTYELDHLVPLAIGGDNSAANLFPEAAVPKPGFREKDVVEVYLQREVCAGNLDLVAAQKQVATDWVAVYNALDSGTVSEIKQKYRNWSN